MRGEVAEGCPQCRRPSPHRAVRAAERRRARARGHFLARPRPRRSPPAGTSPGRCPRRGPSPGARPRSQCRALPDGIGCKDV